MINFTKTTIQKEGILQEGDTSYSINVVATNSELTRLHCGITKKSTVQHPDGNGGQVGVEEDVHLGHISMEHGRQFSEILQGENLAPHLIKFQEILDEVLGQSIDPVTKTTKK